MANPGKCAIGWRVVGYLEFLLMQGAGTNQSASG
uniref:Uncharacterized protein n=1 Tax=Anguilla anguilla TaxID=7936 RepID=A0A0E9XMS0_ANGAN